MSKILSKFTERLLAPRNAFIAGLSGEYETLDGVTCRTEPIGTWNNKDGYFEEEFDDICQRFYGCPFSAIRSIWFGRLGKISDIWDMVKMIPKKGL